MQYGCKVNNTGCETDDNANHMQLKVEVNEEHDQTEPQREVSDEKTNSTLIRSAWLEGNCTAGSSRKLLQF